MYISCTMVRRAHSYAHAASDVCGRTGPCPTARFHLLCLALRRSLQFKQNAEGLASWYRSRAYDFLTPTATPAATTDTDTDITHCLSGASYIDQTGKVVHTRKLVMSQAPAVVKPRGVCASLVTLANSSASCKGIFLRRLPQHHHCEESKRESRLRERSSVFRSFHNGCAGHSLALALLINIHAEAARLHFD